MSDLRDTYFPQISASSLRFTTPQMQAMDASLRNRETVAAASTERQNILAQYSPQQTQTGIQNDNQLAEDPLVQELNSLTVNEVWQRYGPEMADYVRNMRIAGEHIDSVGAMSRGAGEVVGDTVRGVTSGALRGFGGMAAFGAGMINDRAGAAISGATEGAVDYLQSGQSYPLRANRDLAAVRGQLNQEDINRTYEDELERGVGMAGLRRAGREFLAAGSDLAQNPILAGDAISEGVGSLAAGGGLGGLAGRGLAMTILTRQGMTRAAAREHLRSEAGKEFLDNLVVGGTTAAIGLLEGGGAYSQIQNEIQNMSEAELMEGSAEYRALRAADIDHETARDRIANMAGLEGGAIQGLIGAATGRFVARFEANPLASSVGDNLTDSLRRIGSNILKETAEEGFQEGSGEYQSGRAVQRYADESRDPWEGVGTGVATGMIAGAGTAAAVQSPRIAADTAVAGGRAVAGGVSSVAERRLAGIDAREDAQSNVGREAVRSALTALPDTVGVVQNNIEPQATSPESSGNVDASAGRRMRPEEAGGIIAVTGAELNRLPAAIQRLFNEDETPISDADVLPRSAVLSAVLDEFNNGIENKAEEAQAALWVHEQAQRLEALRDLDESTLTTNGREAAQQARDLADTILSSPEIKTILERSQSVTSADLGPMPEVTPETINTAPVQQMARTQATLARTNPAGVDPRFINQVLNQRRNTSDSLIDEADTQAMRVAAQLAQEAVSAEELKKTIATETTAAIQQKGLAAKAMPLFDVVRQQILSKGRRMDLEQFGLTRHVSEVLTAMQRGDLQLAQHRLDNLSGFAEHMQNKLEAARESYALGRGHDNKIKFRTWTGSEWLEADHEAASDFYVNPNSPVSMQLGREIAVDAASVARTYNSLLEQFGGQLRGQAIEFQDTKGSLDMTQDGEPELTQETETSVEVGTEVEVTPTETAEAVAQEEQSVFELGQVQLTGSHRFLAKDQAKSDQATKMIGRGSDKSSTARYAQDWGDRANSGQYTAEDVVFVSAEGNRRGRIPIDKTELQKASDAGVTFITDPEAERNRAYNSGEREVAQFLVEQGYTESAPGTWTKAIESEVSDGTSEQPSQEGTGETQISDQEGAEPTGDAPVDPVGQEAGETETQPTATQEAQDPSSQATGEDRSQEGPRESQTEAGALSTARRLQPGLKFSVMPAELQEVVRGRIRNIDAENGTELLGRIQHIIFQDDSHLAGHAFWDQGILSLSPMVIENLDKKSGFHVLAHELGHFLDARNPGETLSSVESERFSSNNKGDIYQEIIAQVRANEKYKNYFSYALNMRSDAKKSLELFAQLYAGYEMNAKQTREDFPLGTAFIEDLIAERGREPFGLPGIAPQGQRVSDGVPPTGETETTPTATEEVKKDNLVKNRDGISRFTRAFSIKPEKSGAMQVNSPLNTVRGLLSNIKEYIGNLGLDYPVHTDRAETLQSLIDGELVPMLAEMNARLKSKEKSRFGNTNKEKKTRDVYSPWEAIIKLPVDATNQVSGFALNVVDETTGEYDNQLLEAAGLAALHWVQTTITETNTDLEDVAKLWGVPESELQPWQVWAANNGINQTVAKEALAQEIKRFWGVDENRQAPETDVQGILEGMAAELLEVMEKRFTTRRDITNPMTKKTHVIVEPRADKTRAKIKSLLSMDSFLADVFVQDAEKPFYFNEVPNKPITGKKGDPLRVVSKLDRDSIDSHRQIPHTVNRPLVKLSEALGREFWLKIRGYSEYDPETTHVKTAESLKGQNSALEQSWDRTMAHVERNDFVAERDGLNPDEVVSHFDYFLGSNDRIMAKGFNGQLNKTIREVLAPTKAVLDLTKDEHKEVFWMTVAQSLGIKVEKLAPGADLEALSRERISQEHAATAEEFYTWLAEGQGEISDASRRVIEDEITRNGPLTDKAYHALLAVARYDLAHQEGEKSLKAFDHRLAFEADGVTDGPVNAMVHFGKGLTLALVRGMARGGYFLSAADVTLNEYKQTDSTDNYEAASALTQDKVLALKAELTQAGPDFKTQMDRLLHTLNTLGDIEFDADKGKITIGRTSLKNPLTITIYGSSPQGISDKVASGLLEALYAKMSDLAALRAREENPKLTLADLPNQEGKDLNRVWNDLGHLMTTHLYQTSKGKLMISNRLNPQDKDSTVSFPHWSKVDILKWQPSAGNVQMLSWNIQRMYVDPMVEAIDEVTAGANERSRILRSATQIQGLVFREAYLNEITKREADKGEGLSSKEKDEIYNDLSRFAAVIESISGSTADNFHLNLSAPDRVRADGSVERKVKAPKVERTRSFTGRYGGPSTVFLPGIPGPAAAPMLTIAAGDGRMMKLEMTRKEPIRTSQPVFDGWELDALNILKGSEQVNESVLKGWEENPMQVAYESFKDFLRQKPLDQIQSAATYDAIWDAFAAMETDPSARAGMRQAFTELANEAGAALSSKDTPEQRHAKLSGVPTSQLGALKEATLELLAQIERNMRDAYEDIEARKEVLKSLAVSVHHMAGAPAPFTRDGELIAHNGDMALLARALERRHRKALARIQKARDERENLPVMAEPDAKLSKTIETVGRKVKTTQGQKVEGSVTRLTVSAMTELLKQSNLPRELWGLFKLMEKKLPSFKILVGTPEDLNAYRDRFDPTDDPRDPIDLGLTDFATGTIYVSNVAPETIMHELLHAMTAAVTYDFYGNPELVTDLERDTLQNLENLMNQVKDMDFSNESDNVREAIGTMQTEIRRYLAQGDIQGKGAALQEFIAWTLTNQNITETLKKAKDRTSGTNLRKSSGVVHGEQDSGPVKRLKTILARALNQVRRLLGIPPGKNLDIFANVAWNTGVLIQTQTKAKLAARRKGKLAASILLNQVSPNNDPRVQQLAQNFEEKIAQHLRVIDPLQAEIESDSTPFVSEEALALVEAHGFDLDPQQSALFKSMQAVFASSAELNSEAMLKAQELFQVALKNLTVESLMENPVRDANGNYDPNDYGRANEKLNLLTGKYGTQKDAKGRSNMLPTFLALAQMDPQLRKALRDVPLPKGERLSKDMTFDRVLETLGDRGIDWMSNRIISGESEIKGALDKLTKQLARIEQTNHSVLETLSQSVMTTANERVSSTITKGAELVTSLVKPKDAKAQDNKIRKALWKSSQVLESLVTKDPVKQEKAVRSVTALLNSPTVAKSLPEFVPALVDEIMGITDENRDVYEMMNPVRYNVSRMRQIYRQDMPKILAAKFNRKLEKAEWQQLYTGLAQTDIVALGETLQISNIREMLQDQKKLDLEISKAKEELKSLAMPAYHKGYLQDITALAKFMVTREIDPGNHQFRKNALAIAVRAGSKNHMRGQAPEPLVQLIDRLTTLEALNLVDPTTKETLKQLAQTEKEGLDYLLYYLADLRAKEMAKKPSGTARMNGFKGYAPADTKQGISLIVADDADRVRLAHEGYTRLGDYEGTSLDKGKRGYYYSTVGGHTIFHQGIMQTVQQTWMGVDSRNGRTLTGLSGGMLDRKDAKLIHDKILNGQYKPQGEPLMPIYNDRGAVIGYERSLSPEMIQRLKQNTHLGEMVGAWAGRHVEESMAQEFNKRLIQNLHKTWKDGRDRGQRGEYIDLSDPEQTTPIQRDAWNMIPFEAKEEIKKVFGEDGFMVRRMMVNNSVGYRGYSISEAWTGPSNLNPEVRKLMRNVLTMMPFMGTKAMRNALVAQKALQAGVSVAKNLIIVLSIVVPVANALSNVSQLLMNSVSPRDILTGFKTKLVEVEKLQKWEKRLSELTADKARHHKDPMMMRKLEAEEKSINDAIDRLSIGPLVRAGEFTSIVEGETEVDAAISEGVWVDKLKEWLDRVPEKAGVVGRYAAMTKDTAIFKGLARSVQYGDFLAKAILYDQLTKKEDKSHKEAMKNVVEQFVAYNFLPSRERQIAESIGASWFWAYKIRSIKVAQQIIRDNPLRALTVGMGGQFIPGIPGVNAGSPVSDNALNVFAEGRAHFSLGWGMLWRAPSLHPVLGGAF